MTDGKTLQITTPTDRELALIRAFDAPRQLVFDAYTRPELVRRWLGVFKDWTMEVCEIDLRVGGAYRFVWRNTKGHEMGMGGTYLEIVSGEKIVASERFDDPWYEGEAVVTTTFVEERGRTTLTSTVRYDSKAIRDAVLQSPMETGVAASYNALEALLPSLAAQA
jgi:uncharacterized protein YndB with AHSA1/START domain